LLRERFPGEVDADAVSLVEGAQPERVGRDRPDLRGEQKRREGWPEGEERPHRGHGVLGWDGGLRLELVSAARREAEPEVRRAIRRRARYAELLGRVRRVGAGDRMPRPVGWDGAETALDRNSRLHPDLVDPGSSPAREETRAVSESEQLVKVRLDGRPRQ